MLNNSTILVTGADGFIGSHLTEALVRKGFKVRAFVMYNSFNSWGWLDYCDSDIKGQFEIFAGDIRDPHGVKKAMKGCDAVIHLAALIAIPFSYHSPDTYVDTNSSKAKNGNGQDLQTKALSKMMSSNEIVTLINALGTGSKDFNINDLRYEKIVIMTDADVDGSHIRTLLITLFNNYPFNELIEKNHIYLAQPPLYKITKGSKNYYIKDDKELESFLIKSSNKAKGSIKKNSKEFSKFLENEKSKINMQRFKGLGEMNPEELWETTLNPEKRTLLLVKYSNNTKAKSKKDQDLIQILMGDEVAPRKNFIINRALEVSNLDI